MILPCLIFDMDGTLVDSETLGNRALLDLLPDWDEDLAAMTERYRGEKLARILVDIAQRAGVTLPDDFEARYRAHAAMLIARELQTMPGVPAMLDQLPHRRCIASSGPPAKIRQALAATGIAAHFGERIYSAYDVGSWKPDPGLFLHAAAQMGRAPAECIVIEDSEVGVAAAQAAGMRCCQYLPDGGTPHPHALVFDDMGQLPFLLDKLAA
ncbi:haloacid dehalogenase superfamily, subfamily IA, variant 3 with third motif having DD or ED [Andreprevotia lacus DSM 23236]|jgi:HAD superfamily hydrolase (TIGR01509 family)|uniref:Haloacid dehalogenase superfamily, subfamily IA, variant 3 with third motif having DD or ED n=1 Tax=Andreprevotia lacus DSM 23236 TaxID=1121001 RepID=A0A1W1XLP2_9NEIS|nr:HAD-IA family hydrolase [Andreprevotia lacus]SMC24438.1 haloacid dehalogenase superfamily, subfamily IA, variant 3 with third motif having DD or ED [Andreprevotia lacus DSM 23236]